MNEILKYIRANVKVTDEEGAILFEDHNLFTDSGRALIAKIFVGTVPYGPGFDYTKIVCDLGDNSTVPSVDNVDLASIVPPFSAQALASCAMTVGYPIALLGEAKGVHFQFSYTAVGDQTIKELGLFYRPYVVGAPTFPARGVDPTLYTGTMIARLKTALSSIVVGSGRIITIDWKIIF